MHWPLPWPGKRMPSIIISERVALPVSRPRRLTLVPRSILAPDMVATGPGRHVGGREGAEQIGRGQRAGHREVLRAQIGDRHADGGRAADQRAGDQHRLGNFVRLGDHFALGARVAGIGHGEKGCRPKQRRQSWPARKNVLKCLNSLGTPPGFL